MKLPFTLWTHLKNIIIKHCVIDFGMAVFFHKVMFYDIFTNPQYNINLIFETWRNKNGLLIIPVWRNKNRLLMIPVYKKFT